MLTLFGDIQIPLLAAMLLGGCMGKLAKVLKARSMAAGLGPTALFPLRLRRPAAIAMCATEFGLGMGLILTCSDFGRGGPAILIRVGTGLLFLVAALALIELRSVRPDVGCGCFGEFSQTPVTGRTIARSALLSIAALSITRLGPIEPPKSTAHLAVVLFLLLAELGLFGLLSPEVQDLMVRIGYSAPCELRVVSQEHTLAALHRSAQWRKHASLITDQRPSDVWRELCWRYITYPSRHDGKDTEIVFAVRLEARRPVVLSAMVDAATGAVLPWPAGAARPARARRAHRVGQVGRVGRAGRVGQVGRLGRVGRVGRVGRLGEAGTRAAAVSPEPVAGAEAASLPGLRGVRGVRGDRPPGSRRRFPPS